MARTEFIGEMCIVNIVSVKGRRKKFFIELRGVRACSYAANIYHTINLKMLQQLQEEFNGVVGVTDGEKRMRIVQHWNSKIASEDCLPI